MSDTIELNISDLRETLERMSAVLLATETENERLCAALADMIEITKRNSEAELMLIAIRTCAEHALADQGKG